MGHRANYAVRRGDTLDLRYSHWGALTVPQDVFWGPTFALAFVELNEPAAAWEDDISAEGGVGIDVDAKRCVFFGGHALGHGAVGELALALTQRIWVQAGWTVERANDLGDVAECVGVARDTVRAPMLTPRAMPPEALRRASEGVLITLVTLRENDETTDYIASAILPSVLAAGPELLELELTPLAEALAAYDARELEAWETERRAPNRLVRSFVDVNVAERRVTVSDAWDLRDERVVAWLRERWSGWTLVVGEQGAASHFALSGREAPPTLVPPLAKPSGDEPPAPSREECLGVICEALLGERRDILEFARRGLEDGADKTLWVHPSYLVPPADGRPPPEVAARLLGLAWASLDD